MKTLLKYALYGFSGLLALLLIATGILVATFDPNDYKPLIVKLVKEKKQRTLNIEGDIKLAFWPKLGADLGKVSLSEHNGDKQFAAMQSAKVFVAVMPLLSRQLVIDTIHIDGIQANIVRYKDGSTNFDDLLSKEEDSEELKFDIDGIHLTRAALTLNDEAGGRHFVIDSADIITGHVAKDQPVDLDTRFHIKGDVPAVDAAVQFKGTLIADSVNKQFGARGMQLAVQGDVATLKQLDLKLSGDLDAKPEQMTFAIDDLKLALTANLDGKATQVALDAPSLIAQQDEVSGKRVSLKLQQSQGKDKTDLSLVIADLKGSPKAFQSSGVSGEIAATQGARKLAGKFSGPFSGNLETRVFELPGLAGNIDIQDPALPNAAAKIAFNITARADLKQEQARAGLDMTIDASKLKGSVAVAGFARPAVKFDLTADQLDLNKLLGSNKQPAPSTTAAPAGPADLSALKSVLAEGKLNVGSILYDKYRISGLALALRADGKQLDINPLSAKLDDSQIKGSVGIRNFERALFVFDIDIDRIDVDRYLPAGEAQPAAASGPPKAPDLSALKALNADGSLRIGSLKYGKVQSSNIRIDLKADGRKVNVDPFAARVDDSQIRASLGITRLENPVFAFNVEIDKLDADRYITKSEPGAKPAAGGDTPIDLSALKPLNANGEARLGWLKVANIRTSNVRLNLKADAGQVALSPFSADLYQGSMAGSLNVDARATPAIALKQDMKGIQIGPLLVDAINNDMLDGKGTLSLDVKTQGATVNALKKALNGNAAVVLAEGAVKGVDIAGTVRDIKSKFNFKGNAIGADQKKKTDFSEMTASFKITNGVARNDDLSMKSPLLRVTGSGDIDIGGETLNYTARPTVVATLKGQGGSDLGSLNGLTFPVKVTGPFSAPKYGFDFAAIGTEIAKKGALDKLGGGKGEAVQKLIGGDTAGGLEGLLGKKPKAAPVQAPAEGAATQTAPAEAAPAPAEAPKPPPEEKARKKLNKLLGL